MPPNDVPPLADPAHDGMRGELARLLVVHKADYGAGDFADDEVVAKVDDTVWQLLCLVGRAELAGNREFLRRFAWFVDACDRLQADQPAVPFDG